MVSNNKYVLPPSVWVRSWVQLIGGLWFSWGCREDVGKAAVSSERSAGEGSASSLTPEVLGRTRFFAALWTEAEATRWLWEKPPSLPCPVSFSRAALNMAVASLEWTSDRDSGQDRNHCHHYLISRSLPEPLVPALGWKGVTGSGPLPRAGAYWGWPLQQAHLHSLRSGPPHCSCIVLIWLFVIYLNLHSFFALLQTCIHFYPRGTQIKDEPWITQVGDHGIDDLGPS